MRFLKCQLGETANRGIALVSKFAKHRIRAKSHKLHHSSGLRVMLWKVLLLFHQCKVSIMNQRLITINGTGWQCTCPGELRKFRSWVERSGDTRIGESFHFLSRLWSFFHILCSCRCALSPFDFLSRLWSFSIFYVSIDAPSRLGWAGWGDWSGKCYHQVCS